LASFLATGLTAQRAELEKKLSPGLAQLVPPQEARSLARATSSRRDWAHEAGVLLRGNQLAVRIEVRNSTDQAALRQEISRLGGEATAAVPGALYCWLPDGALLAVAGLGGVQAIVEQAQLEPSFEPASTEVTLEEALRNIGAGRLTGNPTGRGVNVGIIDFGFAGYEGVVQQHKLPSVGSVQDFTSSDEDGTNPTHGTETAMVVHAIAPDARLFLARVGKSEQSFVRATQWMAEHNVRIVNFSGGTPQGRGDDAGMMNQRINQMARAWGILTVVAAGNGAQRHFRLAAAADRDGDGWIDIPGQSEPFLRLEPDDGWLRFVLRWGPNAPADFDAVVYPCRPSAAGCVEMKKYHIQAGSPECSRAVVLLREGRYGGREYYLGFQVHRKTRPFMLHVFASPGETLDPHDPAGSVFNPAAASLAIAVGAVSSQTGDLEPFSSQGPSDDYRTKPDVTAPSGVVLPVLGVVAGTSISAPFVTGAAALLAEQSPSANTVELRETVLSHVTLRGSRSPNNQFGRGVLALAPFSAEEPCRAPSIPIPQIWGGCLTARTLDRWRSDPQGLSDAKVNLVTDQQVYHTGDHLRLQCTSSSALAYVLFYREADGQYRTMPLESRGWLTSGVPLTLTATLGPPLGEEELILIYSSSPANLRKVEYMERPPESIGLAVARYRLLR